MHWIENISIPELESACPELRGIVVDSNTTAEIIVDQIRESKATTYVTVHHPILRKQEFGPDGLPIYNDTETLAKKDFGKKEVKDFDLVKKRYWEKLKLEIRLLICTDDKKYKGVRSKLKSVEDKGDQALVAIISAAIGNSLGVAAGAISGLISVLLFAAIKIGVNAYCAASDCQLPHI